METVTPDLDRLRRLPPLVAVAELIAWWPSEDELVRAVRRFLPETAKSDAAALRGWRARGIPRGRQTAVMRAAAEELGIEIDFDLIERLTADRIGQATTKPRHRVAA